MPSPISEFLPSQDLCSSSQYEQTKQIEQLVQCLTAILDTSEKLQLLTDIRYIKPLFSFTLYGHAAAWEDCEHEDLTAITMCPVC